MPNKHYCDNDELIADDFSPDVSEYIPSPDPNRPSRSPSSFGGDSDYITAAIEDITRTPSTVSNVSSVFKQIDFVASPSIIYEAVKLTDTPKSSTYTNATASPVSAKPLDIHSRKKTKRCLNPIFNNRSSTSHTLEKDTQLSIESEEPTDLVDLDKTLQPENNSDSILTVTSTTLGDGDNTVAAICQSPDTNSRPETSAASVDEVSSSFSTNKPKLLTRKRIRNEQEHQDAKSKKLKNAGESYMGCRSKKKYEKKKITAGCKCAKKCEEKFTLSQREDIMKQYYTLGDHERQWQFIVNHTTVEKIKRVKIDRKNNRTQTVKYYFDLQKEKVQVCRTFFVNTLCISSQTIHTALEKNNNGEALQDLRGQHQNRPRKMLIDTEESIVNHINLFPAVEAHYVRKETNKKYLSELLNISKMYRLYKTWFAQGSFDFPMATKRQYQTIFNTRFNYSFFKPKKDQCSKCALYRQADPDTKETLQEKYDQHQRNKERVRQIKKEEKESCNRSQTTIAIFDLEKVLNIPQSAVGVFHYKRKYPIYNFTIFDANQRKGYCYVWHAQIAKRGAIEIGSCLWQFLNTEKQRGIENLSFYSDGCAGQNKNRFIFALYMFAAKKLQINITHRFFETGHGQSEGDSMHSVIERELKNQVVYTPDQMYAIITNAKVNGEKYIIKEMLQSDFYDIKELLEDKNWIKDDEGKKITWSKIMEINAASSEPSILRFKYDFDAEYSKLNTERQQRSKRGARHASNTPNINDSPELKIVYNEPLPIRKALHSDLISLCKSNDIPSYYHGFYKSLKFTDETEAPTDDFADED